MKTYGTRETELVVTTVNGEEVVLKQKFVVGEVSYKLPTESWAGTFDIGSTRRTW